MNRRRRHPRTPGRAAARSTGYRRRDAEAKGGSSGAAPMRRRGTTALGAGAAWRRPPAGAAPADGWGGDGDTGLEAADRYESPEVIGGGGAAAW
jgi:hypothetical protein